MTPHELMLTRNDCERLIVDAGLPTPAKSACYMCPHRTNAEWRAIRDGYPDQWVEAVALDEDIRAEDLLMGKAGVGLHSSGRPLGEADIDLPDRRLPSRQCGLGMCFL